MVRVAEHLLPPTSAASLPGVAELPSPNIQTLILAASYNLLLKSAEEDGWTKYGGNNINKSHN